MLLRFMPYFGVLGSCKYVADSMNLKCPSLNVPSYSTTDGRKSIDSSTIAVHFFSVIIKYYSCCGWSGPSPDTHQVLLSQCCILLGQYFGLSKVSQVLDWIRNHDCMFSPNLMQPPYSCNHLLTGYVLWSQFLSVTLQDERLIDGGEAFSSSNQCHTAGKSPAYQVLGNMGCSGEAMQMCLYHLSL